MKDRFFDDTIIKKFSIGFASDAWDELYNELKEKFDNEVIKLYFIFYIFRFRLNFFCSQINKIYLYFFIKIN